VNPTTVLRLLLPYCLHRESDGSYVALNRLYKPIGFSSSERVEHLEMPVSFRFAEPLGPATIKALSWKGDPDPDNIVLYGDSVPNIPKDFDAYLARLKRLATLKVN
jgi:hypothetical protein